MSSVDDRIVNMKFNNTQFTQGASQSKKSLEDLERTVANTGKGQGLSQMATAVEQTTGRFSALRIAGITAVATIATKATEAGISMVKSLTLDPITAGFQEYQTNLNSIQTIMANTGKSVNVVNSYLNDLNHYSDQTIYNFSQMADSIGKFTAAGVPIKDATSSIKGMANMAALSGSNVQQLNTAMYQMSQALSTGTIRLMDWNSLANAGMGGSNIREALMATNRTLGDHGAAMDASIKKYGSFRDSLQAGWLSAKTFNKTMKVMAGQQTESGDTIAYTVKQLQKMGYSLDAAKQLNKLSQASIESATKVKTASQAIDVIKESVGSGWAKIFQDLFGNFTEATKLWTGVTTSITGVVSQIFGSVDEMLVGWRNLGGYQDLWTGFGNIFKTIGNLISPFVAAFKSLLPATSSAGSGLAKATGAFATVTGWMEKASRGAVVLAPILTAVFGVFKKIGSVGGAVVQGLAPLAPVLRDISNSIGNMAEQGANIASGILGGLLKGLNVGQIQSAVTAFANNIVDWIKGALGIHSPAAELVPVGINIAAGIAKGIVDGTKAVFSALGKLISGLFDGFQALFGGMSSLDFVALFNAILTGAVLLSLKQFMTVFTNVLGGVSGTLDSLTSVIDETGNSLKAWQSSLKAKIILEIAIAVGILTASVIALSMIDPKKLGIGLGAITTMMATLSGTLLALSKIGGDKQMFVLATSLGIIATAMIGLATAVIMLGSQDLKTLEKGLGAIAVVLGLLVGAMFAFSKIKGSVEGMAGTILVVSIALNILAAAVLAFGSMDMGTLAKGFGAIAIGLGLMVGALLALSTMKGSIEGAAGSILIMSIAMGILAATVGAFGQMDMKTIGKGFFAVALGLGLMVGALLILSGNTVGVMAGATAMVLMAFALNSLMSVILIMGVTPWGVIAKGLTVVALALGILILAGYLAIAAAPGLLALGAAVALLGIGLALAGAGMALFGTGFALMAATGTAGIAVMVAAISAFIALLPSIATQIAAAFVAFLKVIANASDEIRPAVTKIFANMIGVIIDNIPVIVDLIVTLVNDILDGIGEMIPHFGHVFSLLIKEGLRVLKEAVPQYIDAGVTIISRVLDGMNEKMPHILDAAGDLIVTFVKGLGDQASKIVDAAGETILKFLHAVDAAVVKYSGPISDAGFEIAKDLIDGVTGGLLSYGTEKISSAIGSLGDLIPGKFKSVLGINSPSRVMIPIGSSIGEGMAKGISSSHRRVIVAIGLLADKIVSEGNAAVLRVAKAATKAQAQAYAMQAKAEITAERAREAAKYASDHKKDKAAQKRANELQKQADAQQKAADRAQTLADKANQRVEDVKTFQNASLHEKGDIKDQLAVDLADRSAQMLAKANAEAARARELMKTNRAAGLAMLKQARKDAAAAKKLENQARQSHKDAQKYYAQEVADRIKQIDADAKADAKERADQEAYDKADDKGKAAILTNRAKADEATAKAAKALAKRLMLQAKKLAHTDAKKAMELLDLAEEAAKKAQEAADKAKEERKQAEDLLNGDKTDTGTGTDTGSGSTTILRITKSILEDASRSIDRYTASLLEASELAAAQQGVIQFVQNNHSPESLSSSEIYRQSKNLLSSAEVKMGA